MRRVLGLSLTVLLAACGSDQGSSSRNDWQTLQSPDGMDALVHTSQGISLAMYCTENRTVEAMITSDVRFDRNAGFQWRDDEGELHGYGGDWGCLSDMKHCSTEEGDHVQGSLPLIVQALQGGSVSMVFGMDDGTTKEITYDFSGVQDRFVNLRERCRAS